MTKCVNINAVKVNPCSGMPARQGQTIGPKSAVPSLHERQPHDLRFQQTVADDDGDLAAGLGVVGADVT